MTLSAQTIASQSSHLLAARRAMIDSQLRVSGINQDWLLDALARVPREDFVPAAARGHAYIDRAVPLDDGQMLPAPLVQASLLAEAAPKAGDKVLVVSPAGYLAALVEGIVQSVETVSPAAAASMQAGGAFDLILIDGAIEHLPEGLVAALAPGGRIVSGLVLRGVTRLAAGTQQGGTIELVPLSDLGMPVLREFAAPKKWSF